MKPKQKKCGHDEIFGVIYCSFMCRSGNCEILLDNFEENLSNIYVYVTSFDCCLRKKKRSTKQSIGKMI
jgi:hypothetical protein